MAARCPLIIFLCLTCALLTAGAMAETVKNQGCPEGWAVFGSRCFKFFNEPKTWTDAETSCLSLDSNLPSIHSDEENAFIVDLIRAGPGKKSSTWLGGYDAVKEGRWMWSDGSKWNYTHWSGGQPDNFLGPENNLMINFGASSLWHDCHESWTMAYICSKHLPPPPQSQPRPVSLTLEGFVYQCTPDPE